MQFTSPSPAVMLSCTTGLEERESRDATAITCGAAVLRRLPSRLLKLPPEPSFPPRTGTSSSQPQFETPLAVGAIRQLAEPPSGAQTRKKRWKGKAKATLPGDEVADDDAQEDARQDDSIEAAEVVSKCGGEAGREPGTTWQENGKDIAAKIQRELGSLYPQGRRPCLHSCILRIQTMLSVDDLSLKTKRTNRAGYSFSRSKHIHCTYTAKLSFLLLYKDHRLAPLYASLLPLEGHLLPTKLVTGLHLDDATRTPARRIPIRTSYCTRNNLGPEIGVTSHRMASNESAFAASFALPQYLRVPP